MIAYKFLRQDGKAPFARLRWPQPNGDGPGAWIEAAPGALAACTNGVHACAVDALVYWLDDELWEIELDGETIAGPQALVARRGRLLRRLDGWSTVASRAFGERCLARVQSSLAAAEVASERAHAYARESQTFAEQGDGVLAAYAAALAFSALVAGDAEAAFHTERREQSRVLARMLNLPGDPDAKLKAGS